VQLQAASSMPDMHLLSTPSTRAKHATTGGAISSATLKRKQQHAKDSTTSGTVTTTPDSKTHGSSSDAVEGIATEQHSATTTAAVTAGVDNANDADNAKREELYNVSTLTLRLTTKCHLSLQIPLAQ
jgi:phage-related tail fiber protein